MKRSRLAWFLAFLSFGSALLIFEAELRFRGAQALLVIAPKDVRIWAVRTLPDFGERALGDLILALEDEEIELRHEAMMALGSMGPRARSAAPHLQAIVSEADQRLIGFSRCKDPSRRLALDTLEAIELDRRP